MKECPVWHNMKVGKQLSGCVLGIKDRYGGGGFEDILSQPPDDVLGSMGRRYIGYEETTVALTAKDTHELKGPIVYEGIKDDICDKGRKTVLIAEDNDGNYLLLYKVLQHQWTVVRARDGIDAVRLHAEISPDLILMDIKMPRMDGLEATKLIRIRDPAVPIVAVTAYAFADEYQVALEVGCNFVITKPVSIQRLRELLAELI